jgi:class 3 adenylate cyclase
VFPRHVAEALIAGRKVEPEQHDSVTVYFSDIVGFTNISSALAPIEVSDMLHRLYTRLDAIADQHGVFKVETIGDAWMGVTNLVQAQPDHAARIARFALDAVQAARATHIRADDPAAGTVRIRVGFHSGPVVANVVGARNPRFCLFGDTGP